MTSAGVHQMGVVRFGDLILTVAAPTARATMEIVVERDASLVLKAPQQATLERAERFIASKRQWIYRKLAEKDALVGPPIVKQFVDGEGFAYLGRSHRLIIDSTVDAVRLDRGRFIAPATVADAAVGPALMREWYVRTGRPWLERRLGPWSRRLGIDPVRVDVRDLGYRWGSARLLPGAPSINVHWATLQLPPSLIDYVLVHELSHLREANHTPEFWSVVGQLLPAFEGQRALLASVGRNVWLGEER